MSVPIARAEGIYLYDDNGKQYIDASGGPFSVNLPHNHPRMKQAIAAQLDKYAYTHPVMADPLRAEFCRMLAEITPGDLDHAYLVSGGSEAVETAFKIARQAQINRGHAEKYKIISHHDSYHGMTLATLGASGSPGSHAHFVPMLPKWPHIRQYSDFDRPEGTSRDEWGVVCAQALETAIHYEGPQTVAAFLATPHGCGPDYAVVPPKTYWEKIREICDRYDVLLIADEVVTGFGRTGTWFAMEQFGVLPDIMTLAKGISSSYVPFGAVAVSASINQPFEEGAYFVHGFTNGGHPLACAAGCELINIIRDERLLENCRAQSEVLFSHRDSLLAHPTVRDVRGWGLMLVLELLKDKETLEFFEPKLEAEKLFQALALKNGLVMYGTLYGPHRQPAFRRGLPAWISPPLSITSEETMLMMQRLDDTLSEWEAMVL
ncbi:MAG: aminotransferase class III-fold pyridoxal phosphate-dependent enzyme [Pseudomonadales bacterium]|jgi:adenosylmethionine-8-amino-7-oxononanoate aminotransferase|nr:aminotransferase class III-fold pyridoxal phosphate-dependent enzyme [Pseudomonadales bacterium]MDP6471400.1 aminotransferase class III-fold pyridoxal phosphate-dependent enzyme [Pseudomonadales bacterium]MDP6826408.1 aminotransferase class III-fold pyridoxal phosphate-dependent enzyme [Pseudomonadales bacterium]MDP6970961.1 aminotransferase class III-fold pyridoxal phosphate-dependent enzyme [Pseudomonadales bacterium]